MSESVEQVVTEATDAVVAPETPADFAAFELAENAATQTGAAPAPAVAATSADSAPTDAATPDKSYTPPNPKSKRSEKDQAFINERIATAVKEQAERAERAEKALAELKAAPPAATAAEPAAPAAVTDPKDPEPQEGDFETWSSYNAALTRWNVRQVKREDAAAAKAKSDSDAATAAKRDFDARLDTWFGRLDAFKASNPERAARVEAIAATLSTGTPIGDAIVDSEYGAELADYLAAHPEEVARIGALPPLSQIRALGRLETQFSTTTSASASAGPAANTVTKAPAPPTFVAARSADPADPVAAAVMRGDYSTFEAEENRKALTAAGR